ncbi:MAG: hypothetical protein OXF74_14560 [Rhodobacteraceae bacterium]|nr:hypothetical protein [Paracoccaceae bacterium]
MREKFLHRFMTLEHSFPCLGAFPALFRITDPDCPGGVLTRPAAVRA